MWFIYYTYKLWYYRQTCYVCSESFFVCYDFKFFIEFKFKTYLYYNELLNDKVHTTHTILKYTSYNFKKKIFLNISIKIVLLVKKSW